MYDKAGFSGDTLTLAGPVDVNGERLPAVLPWRRPYESIVVGPRATVTLYDHRPFHERTAGLRPGDAVPDLDALLGAFGSIEAVRVRCG
jgi:hypothetical protein